MRRQLAVEPAQTVNRPTATVEMAQLSPGAQLCVWSLRQWVRSAHLGRCTGCDLHPVYRHYSCIAAIVPLQEFMLLLTREAERQIEVRKTDENALSYDELTLLRLFALAGHGRRRRYTRHLARGLVSTGATSELCFRAGQYFGELDQSGLVLTGWPEMQLVAAGH